MPALPPHSVVETTPYLRAAGRLLSQEERDEVVLLVASQPTIGDLIKGTGGVRKIRYAPPGRGKSGAFRIIYFYYNERMPLFLLTLFGKNQKSNLSPAERNALRTVTAQIIKSHKDRHNA